MFNLMECFGDKSFGTEDAMIKGCILFTCIVFFVVSSSLLRRVRLNIELKKSKKNMDRLIRKGVIKARETE